MKLSIKKKKKKLKYYYVKTKDTISRLRKKSNDRIDLRRTQDHYS